MPAPQNELLEKLCGKNTETYRTAQSLLRKALVKTAPGSGHKVGAHTTGLPAICAYLASQTLRNNEISERVAQGASCLNGKDFTRTLVIVRSVLFDSSQDLDNGDLNHSSAKRRPRFVYGRASKNTPNQASMPFDNESPSKKRKVATTPSKPGPSNSPTKRPELRHSRQSPMIDATPTAKDHGEVAMNVDSPSQSDGDDETLQPRRFRPVFLDHKQWYRRDPRLEHECRRK